MPNIRQIIADFKAQNNAIILAHNYVAPELQDIADFVGDSLQLSIEASRTGADVIVVCGVRFMAETAKLLSPKSKVLLVNSASGCPMADMADPEKIKAYRKANPDAILVAYVNTTAEVKSLVDICCTSGNAESVVKSLPVGQKVLFLPDRNLGANLNLSLGCSMELYDGCCPIHDQITSKMLEDARKLHPGALILVHPECRPDVVSVADFSLSTGGMLKFVRESEASAFVIATEQGILHRLKKENPGKNIIPLAPAILCADMKKITIDDLLGCLETMSEEIILADNIMSQAVLPIQRMLEIK